MKRSDRSLFRRLIAAAVSAGMLVSLAACAKAPAETTAPPEPVTAERAITQLQEQSEALGFDNALNALEEKNTAQIGGDTYIRLQQYYEGIPVYGKTIVYAANEQGELTSVTGNVQDVDPDIDLTPTITAEQAQESIRIYAAEVLEHTDTDLSMSEPIVCIYNGNKLAYVYTVTMNGNFFAAHEVLVDAHDADILEWKTYAASFDTNQDILEAADVACESDESQNWKLADARRNHSVHHLNLKTTNEYPTLEAVVGNDDFLATAVPGQAASGETYALARLAQISDFYADVLGRQSYDNQGGIVYVFSCDADLLADNGKSLAYPEYGIIMLGEPVNIFSEPLGKAMDLVAHEYAHLVFQTEVGLSNDLDVTSVNEGIADIFGNLIELYVTGEQDRKWPLSEDAGYNKYNMADPMTMTSYGDEAHDNARILSHSAYLMWNGIDGNESKNIPETELAELWYRAVLMMPSDCDFILCRQLVEVAAQSMESLTDEQRQCVREAFDQVGISSVSEDIEADYHLAVNGTLSVYDEDREYYSGYTLSIDSIALRLPTGDRRPDVDYQYSKTVVVNTAGPYQVDLPAGLFRFEISDAYSPVTYSFTVEVAPAFASNIDFITAYEEPLVVVIPESVQVADAYYDSVSFEGQVGYYHIPQIICSDDRMDSANERIYQELYAILNDYVYGEYVDLSGMAYSWTQQGDIVSILVEIQPYFWGPEYLTFNVSVGSGNLLTAYDVANCFDYTSEAFNDIVRDSIIQQYNDDALHLMDQITTDTEGVYDFDGNLEKTLSSDNLKTVHVFISNSGDFCMTAHMYRPGLEHPDYYHIFNLTGSAVPQLPAQGPGKIEPTESDAYAPSSEDSSTLLELTYPISEDACYIIYENWIDGEFDESEYAAVKKTYSPDSPYAYFSLEFYWFDKDGLSGTGMPDYYFTINLHTGECSTGSTAGSEPYTFQAEDYYY